MTFRIVVRPKAMLNQAQAPDVLREDEPIEVGTAQLHTASVPARKAMMSLPVWKFGLICVLCVVIAAVASVGYLEGRDRARFVLGIEDYHRGIMEERSRAKDDVPGWLDIPDADCEHYVGLGAWQLVSEPDMEWWCDKWRDSD